MIRFVGAKPVPISIREDNGFNFDPDELSALLSNKTRLLILNSPANPTGGVLTRDMIERVVKGLRRFPQVTVLTDEIYSRILYEGQHHSIAAWPDMKERCIILDGFSKTYAMTGWRLGYAVAPRALSQALSKLATNCHSCPASFTQVAAVAALRGPQEKVEAMVAEFRRRRDVIVKGLGAIEGFSCKTPLGAFYAFPNIRGTGLKSKELADALLDKAGVACLSGTAFGAAGEGYLRFSYANSVDNIERALSAIREALPEIIASSGV
jgi:aspartate/methionine/tyrosine aminotransferase